MVEKDSVILTVNLFRCHEFTVRILSVTVDPADQSALGIAVKSLAFLLTIIDHRVHDRGILRAFLDNNHGCHSLITVLQTEDRVIDRSQFCGNGIEFRIENPSGICFPRELIDVISDAFQLNKDPG